MSGSWEESYIREDRLQEPESHCSQDGHGKSWIAVEDGMFCCGGSL